MDDIGALWPYATAALDIAVSAAASAHAVLHKRDSRAAVGWVGLIWLVPIAGTLLYLWLGINRIQRKARSLRAQRPHPEPQEVLPECSAEAFSAACGPEGGHLASLAQLVGDVTKRSLVAGNRVEPLENGDEAYPAMLQAIEGASRSITLCTYIFNYDRAGRRFLAALARAAKRGVAVRVLVDDVGARYGWPPIPWTARRAGFPIVGFMHTLIPWRFRYFNLRLHRKIMVVDGATGFTGGMNISEGNCLEFRARDPIRDIHFRLTGPIVRQLQAMFAEDWEFTTGEVLEGEPWFSETPADGPAVARGIPDGPDEDFEKLRLAIHGAIACAQRSIIVVTPYFLPDAALITALNVAAMRGVGVDIVLPEVNNLKMVKWASTALLWQLIQRGCRVWRSPPPFDHGKLMLVYDAWTLLGSANWDPRSLRLNFEFNVECYDRALAAALAARCRSVIARSRPVGMADVDGRPLPVKLRDGVARLFSPYL